MRKYKKFLRALPFIIIIILVVLSLLLNPLLRTNEGLRRHLLQKTPAGTSMEDVVDSINNNSSWTIRHRGGGIVYCLKDQIPTRFSNGNILDSTIVGEHSIEVRLGIYRIPIKVYVTAFYAFDENGKLIDILVLREYDII